MKKRLMCLGLCFVMLFSATACTSGSDSKREFTANEEDTPSREFVSTIGSNSSSTEASSETDVSSEETTTDVATANDSSETIDGTDLEELGEDTDDTIEDVAEKFDSTTYITEMEYAYFSFSEDGMKTMPAGNITDDTVLYNGVTAGEMASTMETYATNMGGKMDRALLYQLLEVLLIDSEIINDDQTFAYYSLMAVTFAYEFSDKDLELVSLTVPLDDKELRKFSVIYNGEEDVFVSNINEFEFFTNNGEVPYDSDMYTRENLAIWLVAIANTFNIELE